MWYELNGVRWLEMDKYQMINEARWLSWPQYKIQITDGQNGNSEAQLKLVWTERGEILIWTLMVTVVMQKKQQFWEVTSQ